MAEVDEVAQGVKGEFDFETFLKILNRPGGFRDPGPPEEYIRGFQVFDKDSTGVIGVGELKYVLTTLGEKLTDAEVSELLKGMEITGPTVNYIDFVKMILAN
ncbi:SCF ubiquitin ligase complex subunit cdc4 [Orbilia oligospora]|nr:SCF ubiquitin ligase complex subunit cdc4 [Orbilia oligospora]